MEKKLSANINWSQTHFIDKPERRKGSARRKINCFIANDKRGTIACRRKERQREIERKIMLSKITFHPLYPSKILEKVNYNITQKV
ncbi:MAG: hypothetical protein HGJ94_03965 [Desulfosarcina sp.]|nr:hypothetical protein [Desulfosarcina sp.]